MTALELAVIGHHLSLVELLLHYGADPSASNTVGHNVKELAQVNGDKHILSLLQHYDRLSVHHNDSFDFKETENIEPVTINALYTSNNFFLGLNGDIVLKNSPSRPVFKTKNEHFSDLTNDGNIQSLPSPSVTSVFLPSPEMCSTPISQKCNYSCLISPKYETSLLSPLVFESPSNTSKRGKKRKITSSIGCSSWLKRLTKRYANSKNIFYHSSTGFHHCL